MAAMITISDFGNICRTCLQQSQNMMSLSRDIIDLIEACASIRKNLKRCPQQICNNCYTQLGVAYNFKKRCELSDDVLSKVSERLEIEQEEKTAPCNTSDEVPKVEFCESTYEGVYVADAATTVLQIAKNEVKAEDAEPDFQDDFVDSSRDTNDESDEDDQPISLRRAKQNISNDNFDDYGPNDITCKICNKTLSMPSSLRRHLELHKKVREFKHHCPVCNKGFYETGVLNKHVLRHEGLTKYKCDKCTTSFYELSALAVHCKYKHKAKPQKCSKCSQQFYHKLQLERHESKHKIKDFKCDVCNKPFKKPSKLKRHYNTVHLGLRPYPCSLCDKAYQFKFNLEKHKELAHSESPPHVICYICGKAVRELSLPSHLSIHGERSIYNCPECPSRYTSKYTLNSHIKTKHRNPGLKKPLKFFCEFCKKGFPTPRQLKFHTATHTGERPYKCLLCEKDYIKSSSLKLHIESAHENVRQHECSICNKAFHAKKTLEGHMRTHTGERPFQCSVCGKAFGFKMVLKTHMKVHSSISDHNLVT